MKVFPIKKCTRRELILYTESAYFNPLFSSESEQHKINLILKEIK